jgi:cellulose synthase operon protein C
MAFSVVRARDVLRGVLLATIVACAALAQDDQKQDTAAVQEFNVAAALQNSGLYPRAAEKWQAFLQKHPQDERIPRVNYYLGVCRLHTKEYDKALAAFQAVLTKHPQFEAIDGARYNLGMAHFRLAQDSQRPEDFQKAAAAFQDAALKHPQSEYVPRALYYRGESLYFAGSVKEAIDAYRAFVSKHADHGLAPEALYALGTALQDAEQPAEAGKVFQQFLARPELARHELAGEVRLRLGMSLFAQQKHTEAEQHFAEAAKLEDFPHADFAMLRQGECRQEAGKPAEAAGIFNELLTKFPESSYQNAARLAAGKCFYLTEKWDDARKSLEPVVSAGQEEAPEAAYWLGRTFLKQDKAAEALAVLDAALAKNPQGEFLPYLQATRIDALYEIPDRRKETAELYRQFAEQHPEHPLTAQALYMSALTSLANDDLAAARREAEAFLAKGEFAEHELTPAVAFVAAEAHLLGLDADPPGDRNRAETLYRELVQKHPEHANAPRANLRIGYLLLTAEKPQDAIAHLNGALPKLSSPEHKAEAQLLLGRAYSAADDEKQALTAFDASLAVSPSWPRGDEALLGAARSLRLLENPQGAADRLKKLLASYGESPQRPQAIYQLGEIAQEQNQHDEAAVRFREVLEKHAEHELSPPAAYGLGAVYLAQGKHAEATQALDRLLSQYAESDAAKQGRYLRGLVRQRMQQYEPAVQDFEAFLATMPEGDEALDARYALALCRIGLKQYEPATAALQTLLKENPQYQRADDAWYELGHALFEQKKEQEAIAAFQMLAEKHPESPRAEEAWFRVGRHFEQLAEEAEDEAAQAEQLAKAAEAYKTGAAKAQSPELKEKLQFKLGDALFRQKKYAEAGETYLAQVQAFPQGELAGPGRFFAAESLFRQNKFDQARPLYEKVAQDNVEKYAAQALYRAGACAAQMKDWPAGQNHYTALLTKFPDFAQKEEARYGLAWALQNQNRLDEARRAYAQIVADTEGDVIETAAKARFMLGELCFGEKKYEDAIEQFLFAANLPFDEWRALARFEIGRCFMELGKKEQAVASLQEVVQKHADHPRAEDAARLVAELKK